MNRPVPQYSAAAWNDLVREVKKNVRRSGHHMRARALAHDGVAYDYTGPIWRHPWQVEPFWDSEAALSSSEQTRFKRAKGVWRATINPGFINGRDPAIRVPIEDLPDGVRVIGNAYDSTIDLSKEKDVQVLLTDSPQPEIRFKEFINKALVHAEQGRFVAGGYPDYFKFLGAQPPEQLDALEALLENAAALNAEDPGDSRRPGAGTQTIIDILLGEAELPPIIFKENEFPFGPRSLLAADIVLQVDRPSTISDTTKDEFGTEMLSGFRIVSPTRDQYAARLYTTPLWAPVIPPTMQERLAGAFVQPTNDEILIATLYLLSPVEEAGEIPSGSWQPYVRHNVFWNLMFASINHVNFQQVDDSLDFFKSIGAVLAGGSAFGLILGLITPIEAANAAALSALNNTDLSGRFWTAA